MIYISSLSSFNEQVFEDPSSNALQESLTCFSETIKLELFKESSIILFLNKKDLFAEKLQDPSSKEEFKACFPGYDGPMQYDDMVAHVRGQFERLNDNPNRQIYTHVLLLSFSLFLSFECGCAV